MGPSVACGVPLGGPRVSEDAVYHGIRYCVSHWGRSAPPHTDTESSSGIPSLEFFMAIDILVYDLVF